MQVEGAAAKWRGKNRPGEELKAAAAAATRSEGEYKVDDEVIERATMGNFIVIDCLLFDV